MGWFRNLGNDRPWAQGCVIAASGVALAATSCFGFLLTVDGPTSNSVIGRVFTVGIAVLFGVGALAIPGGFIWFIVGLVRNASRGSAAPPPQPPPPQPPGAGQPG